MKLQYRGNMRRLRVRRMPAASPPPPPRTPLGTAEPASGYPPPALAASPAPPPTVAALTPRPHTNGNKRPPPIIIYPTVSPESIVVPIVSCIVGFPLLALTIICCLRRRAKMARERARRRNCELDRGELSIVRASPGKRARAVSLVRSPRALPALELATVLEEQTDPEQTQVEMMTPDREVNAILFPGAAVSGAEGAAAADGGGGGGS